MPNNIQRETYERSVTISRDHINAESRMVDIAFSSETPVSRWFGIEILDHSPGSIRLDRLRNAGPVLLDHDHTSQIGVVESVSLDSDRRGRVRVRFGKSARAEEVFQDVQDGIRVHVSVGYRIHDAVLERTSDEGETYRVTDWEPFEVSFVSVPADPSVGVGRSMDKQPSEPKSKPIQEDRKMPEQKEQATPPAAPAVEVVDNRQQELDRIRKIAAIGEQHGMTQDAAEFIRTDKSVDEFYNHVVTQLKSSVRAAQPPELGLNDGEIKRYSFVRAINALANPNDRRAQEAARFEFECSEAAAAKSKRDTRGILVPVDILKRDLTVGTATAGGHTVATNLLSASFIDLLRNRSVMMQMATVLTDLAGNIAIPRMTGGATAYWVGEGSAPTESQQAFDQVTLSPNTVGAYTEMSRKLLLQSSVDIEALVRRDLATVLGLEIDRVAIEGSGSGAEPEGILNVTGIGAVAGGTNGLAPAWSHIVNLETEVTTDNADMGALRYLTNAKVCGKLKQTEKASGTAQFVWDNGTLNGYQAIVSNQVPSDLTKGSSSGVCSAIIFGNFADLLIGMWGGLDLQVNPYSLDTTGGVRITAFQDIDLAVRHPESFAAMQDALTT